MNKYTAIVICWALAIFVTCFTIYITKCGWWIIILALYDIELGDDEKEKDNRGDKDS